MKLNVLPVSITLALAASVSAQSVNKASAYEVLATALPHSLFEIAVTNQPEVSSIISSEFAAGKTPAWFSSLPKDIQTFLVPVTAKMAAPMPTIMPMMNATMNMTTSSSSKATTHVTTVTSGKSGKTTQVLTMTMGGAGGGGGGKGAATSSPPPSKAGAPGSLPTGLMGAGLAGMVGVIGLLAL